MWIGLNDRNMEGRFLWTSGVPVLFTNWAPKSPRSTHSRQDCAVLLATSKMETVGQWEDVHCDGKHGFICTQNKDPSLPNREQAVPLAGFMRFGDAEFRVLEAPLGWTAARSACRAQRADVASVVSPYEQAMLALIVHLTRPLWIGLNGNLTGGDFGWTDGWPTSVTYWAPEQPADAGSCVAAAQNQGLWTVANCSSKMPVLCKKWHVKPPTVPPEVEGRCPEDPKGTAWVPFRSSCYLFQSSKIITWSYAILVCNRLGGRLATVNDHVEHSFIVDNVKELGDQVAGMWIGMFKNQEGELLWMDNAPVRFTHFEHDHNLHSPLEYCTYVDTREWSWKMDMCYRLRGYVCEAPKEPLASPAKSSSEIDPTDLPDSLRRGSTSATALGALALFAFASLALAWVCRRRRRLGAPGGCPPPRWLPSLPWGGGGGGAAVTARVDEGSSFENALYGAHSDDADTNALVQDVEEQ